MAFTGPLRSRSHTTINLLISSLLLFFLFFHNPFLRQNHAFSSTLRSRRHLSETPAPTSTDELSGSSLNSCSSISDHQGFATACDFLKSHPECSSGGFFDYIHFFYCGCGIKLRSLGYAVLTLWLAALFYMLGNTAADYFCCSLEKLSTLLRLPPTVAGVTLLPLGNGAPDVFASIAAFVGAGTGEVGLNSVLGGAVFVTCIVVGAISLCVAEKRMQIDRKCFYRDIGFFLLTLVSLALILFVGKVTAWGALLFVLIYVLYAFVVAANELLRKHARMLKLDAVTPLLPVRGSVFSHEDQEAETTMHSSLLELDYHGEVPRLHTLPQWMWASNFAIYSNQGVRGGGSLVDWGEEEEEEEDGDKFCVSCAMFFSLLELPLTLPRRLTIPIVEDGRWSKSYGVASAFFAPVLISLLLGTQICRTPKYAIAVYVFGGLLGACFGALAFLYTRSDQPPRRFVFPWVFGGFFMSITWFYIVANELVALLVSLGVIFAINPSILGLTVLAWGNSMGDLMSNIALAINGGDSLQIAMSGCYAGPMFNTLAGLGVSMLLAAVKFSPDPYMIPQDASLVYTMGFLLLGLIWALVILPRSDMRPNKVLGIGLISIYLTFLSIRVSSAIGILSLPGLH